MFKVRPFEAKTLSWWFSERDNIDMNPLYQRRSGLWSQKSKAYLIDSILNDFDIPKIYIADFTYFNTPLNTKNKSYAVIDGKQRLSAIFDFFDGKLTLNQDFIFFEDDKLKLAGLSYKDLKSNYSRIASKFDNYNLSVMSVITDEETKINDLFIRLNTSKPLTGAELRNAMEGLVPNLIRQIANHEFFKSKIKFKLSRGEDLNAAAKILLIEFRGKFVDTKKVHLDKFVEEGIAATKVDKIVDRFVEEGMRSENIKFDKTSNFVMKVLDNMTNIFIFRDPLLSSQGPITLYYWFIRNTEPRLIPFVREFLVNFEKERRENRHNFKEGFVDVEIDEELLTYDFKNRSIDDRVSLNTRYEILRRKFYEFINGS